MRLYEAGDDDGEGKSVLRLKFGERVRAKVKVRWKRPWGVGSCGQTATLAILVHAKSTHMTKVWTNLSNSICI